MIFLVTHPPDSRPALVVETTARIDDATIAQLKERMVGLGCPNGLLFDANECVIIRDTYTSLEPASLEEDGRVATDPLLTRVPAAQRSLDQRVLDWLRSMAAGWNSALPMDGAIAAPFITDIVPAVSGSHVRQVA
jgi:hypothetical protein